MTVELQELSVSVKEADVDLKQKAAHALNIKPSEIAALNIRRRSLDARKKDDIRYKYMLLLDIPDTLANSLLDRGRVRAYTPKTAEPLISGSTPLKNRPVIVGAGPCGLFAAYTLAKHGYQPLLIERGKSIADRKADVDALHTNGLFNPDSNICFGEGGAGTFSDGKLTTRIKDPLAAEVLETFIACGADPAIRYLAKPHLGTDGMQNVIHALKEKIIRLDGDIIFGARLSAIHVGKGSVSGITYIEDGQAVELETPALILATGHSAGDVYRMLKDTGAALEKKPCAIGFRIEHPREMIDRTQLGDFAGKYALGAAEYSLTAKHQDRGVYTFCMCPGGVVVCASSAPETLCINGMSHSRRDGSNSNSAVVATLHPVDSPDQPLGALEFIETIEKNAYHIGGGYRAPAQKVCDYITGKTTQEFDIIKTTYMPGVISADLNSLLPPALNDAIKAGLAVFDRRINGFIDSGMLTGVETRTSSPVRVIRTPSGESVTIGGLYPAGEGAGYAGGIISAAVDGIKTAEQIIRTYHARMPVNS